METALVVFKLSPDHPGYVEEGYVEKDGRVKVGRSKFTLGEQATPGYTVSLATNEEKTEIAKNLEIRDLAQSIVFGPIRPYASLTDEEIEQLRRLAEKCK